MQYSTNRDINYVTKLSRLYCTASTDAVFRWVQMWSDKRHN